MKNEAVLNPAQDSDRILRLTALLYLKEALEAQQYETCPELIGAAKDLGVSQDEIGAVIADYLKTDGPGRQTYNRLQPL